MTRKNWLVGAYGVRPAGKQDECFYCHEKIGDEHKAECVIRSKTIVLRATIEFVATVPEHWDAHNIEFHRNDSWCQGNFPQELQDLDDRLTTELGGGAKAGCMCDHVKFELLRDATPDDETRDKLFVMQLPS